MTATLNWGMLRGRVTVNIAHGIPSLYRANRADKVWSPADFAAIKPHCSKELDWAIRFASLTGFRLGDLVNVCWDHTGGEEHHLHHLEEVTACCGANFRGTPGTSG